MPSIGRRYSAERFRDLQFFLDECLAEQVADALRLVGYPIVHPGLFDKKGIKDPELIPWLGLEGFVWITKDDEAKKRWIAEIRRAGISVIWIRGLERRRNTIGIMELHALLTAKLSDCVEQIAGRNSASHLMLYMKSGDQPVWRRVDESRIEPAKPLRVVR